MTDGIELATGIPGARFVSLDSKNHIVHADDPAWGQMAGELAAFLSEQDASPDPPETMPIPRQLGPHAHCHPRAR
jgi:hypothetical protein